MGDEVTLQLYKLDLQSVQLSFAVPMRIRGFVLQLKASRRR
jgi:hypothetical protein